MSEYAGSAFPIPRWAESWDCAVEGHDWDDDLKFCVQCGLEHAESSAARDAGKETP